MNQFDPNSSVLDYDYTAHENRTRDDKKLYVRFFTDILLDEEASKAAGMRKFRDVEMIHIMVPGNKNNIIIREVRDEDKGRFSDQYTKFTENREAEEQLVGFPLSQWGSLSRATAEELRYLGFRTVESVAEAQDSVLSKHPGLRELQKRAKLWLESQKSTAPLDAAQAKLDEQTKTIESLQAQMAEMAKEMAKLKKA
jgi:hypothetical protein